MDIAIILGLFVLGVFTLLGLLGVKDPRIPGPPTGDSNPTHLRPRHTSPVCPPPIAPHQALVLSGAAYVVDGDTIVICKTQVRLFGVDAPEMDHPYGNKAKGALMSLCRGQRVRAEVCGIDDYGRSVARCRPPDGRDLSAEMVRAGLALDWARFSGGVYRALEPADARQELWLADARQKGRMEVWETFAARANSPRG